ncbi:MAG: GNAT family N-acetyltransferase [Candidatus Acidiferrales bacterium]
MNGPIKVFDRNPKDCEAKEIGDFMALVLAGGEVTAAGLEDRIRSAARLFFLDVGCCLCGIAALKCPEEGYRKGISNKSGVPLSEAEYPFELGWVFVMPSARGRKFSQDLTRTAIAVAGDKGVFATSRTDNIGMHSSLAKCGFLPTGAPYPSTRGEYKLQVFVRHGSRQETSGDAPLTAS